MENKKLVIHWYERIIEICEMKLGRKLSVKKLEFIHCSKGFIALEMIEETVNDLSDLELKSYLNSEIHLDFGG